MAERQSLCLFCVSATWRKLQEPLQSQICLGPPISSLCSPRGLHRAPQGSTGPQGSLGIPRKPYFYIFLLSFWSIFGILGQILRFWVKIIWFFSFSNKNDAESSRNFVKIPFLNPKRPKLDQKWEIGHVRTCQDLSRRTSTYCKPAEILPSVSYTHLTLPTKA